MEAAQALSAVDVQLSEAAAAAEAGNGAEALRILQSLAAQNNATAQYNLGVMHEGAAGIAADLIEAARWYTLAADNGNAMAQYNLGVKYDQGRGVSPRGRWRCSAAAHRSATHRRKPTWA